MATMKDKVADMPLLMSSRGARLLDDKDHQLLKDTIYEAEDNYGESQNDCR